MEDTIKILFVCHGNICRSPMAEYIMKYLVEEQGRTSSFLIDSAATSRDDLGRIIHPEAQKQLREAGIPYEDHWARQIKKEEYEMFDYLIGMDSENIRNLLLIFDGDPEQKIYRLKDFTDQPGKDIADPGHTRDFVTAYREVREGCEELLTYLTKGETS